MRDEVFEQARRQIVDAEIADILERVQHDALAGPGEAAHEDDPHTRHDEVSVPRGAAFLGMVVGGFLLALLHQAVEFIGERIDGGVHVRCGRFGMDIGARHAQGGLRRLGVR